MISFVCLSYFSVLSLLVTIISCLAIGHSARTVENHLSAQDLQRFQSVFITALSSSDLQSIYYAALNIETYKAEERKALCQKLIKLHEESKLNVSGWSDLVHNKLKRLHKFLLWVRNLKKTFT